MCEKKRDREINFVNMFVRHAIIYWLIYMYNGCQAIQTSENKFIQYSSF